MSNEQQKQFVIRNMNKGTIISVFDTEYMAFKTLEIEAQHSPNCEFWIYERVATAKANIPVVVKSDKQSEEAEVPEKEQA